MPSSGSFGAQRKKDLDEDEAVLPSEEEPKMNEMPADMYEYWDKDGNLVEYKGKVRIDEIDRQHE
ncbi:hypothetical protein LTR56_007696 [Elasticomyces elasticus]|nr:hypothetical protein LTR56_007696 [Elasticomyces elasticus]KAK3661932.1 hypothetical protein LTR22_007306 [Elasticomyces elasticus]KAK4925555.1 hypothetical protein LTR49_007393 [Elasticomyces elasticus]KAK5759833.1 hypothetical protein LTS12_010020 [Elasticomyces elasticus]